MDGRPGRRRPAAVVVDGHPAVIRRAGVVLAVAAGGAVGGLARWALAEALPVTGDGIPWATLLANVAGSLLLGVVVVTVPAVLPGDRHLQPFLAVGVLGGFTTFATYAVETWSLLADGRPGVAAAYLSGTAVTCVLAAAAGMLAARRLLPRGRRP